MTDSELRDTYIGMRFLDDPEEYPVDEYLDYRIKIEEHIAEIPKVTVNFSDILLLRREIKATDEILKRLTDGS
jgi:hypothetical protein